MEENQHTIINTLRCIKEYFKQFKIAKLLYSKPSVLLDSYVKICITIIILGSSDTVRDILFYKLQNLRLGTYQNPNVCHTWQTQLDSVL